MEFKNFLSESSLSRIWKLTKEHDSGTISAFRYAKNCGEGELFSKDENKKNSAKLKALLLSNGYGVTKIQGVYIENYGTDKAVEVHEESYIVIDIKNSGNLKKDLKKLGLLFEQDSITYSTKEGVYYLIGTNKCPNGYPGYNKEIILGKPLFGKDGEFHSKVNGRPFVFKKADEFVQLSDYSVTEIRSIKELTKD